MGSGTTASARQGSWKPTSHANEEEPAASTCGFCGSARPRQGFARCARRWRGLDPDLRASHGGHLSKRRGVSKKEDTMFERSLTPNITVTIGHHTRIYFAFVTTAPTELDSPATVTLHAANFADVVTLAAEPITFDSTRGRTPARLVLVDAMELAWQRAKYRGNQHLLVPADPGLVGLNTLQHWLWQRLQTPAASPVAA